MGKHFQGKRVISMLLVAVSLFGLIAPPSANAVTVELKKGDYVLIGNYLNQPILWRYILDNDNGTLMLSHNVISVKAFNSTGIKPANASIPDGIAVPQEPDNNGVRANGGSNLWINSTLRAWLNSDASAGQVRYIGNAPSTSYVSGNPYDGEAGFLTNFTASEKAAMKPVKQKILLGQIDADISVGGNQGPDYGEGWNHNDAFYHEVTDTVFLLDVLTAVQIRNDSSLDWPVDQWWSTSYNRAAITQTALDAATVKPSTSSYGGVDWWLRVPTSSPDNSADERVVLQGGGLSHYGVSNGTGGVRPAFYLDRSAVTITGGSGTLEDPYTIDAFGAALKGDNLSKLYAPDTDELTVTVSAAENLSAKYVTADPADTSPMTVERFSTLNPKPLALNGQRRGTIEIDRNCTVWVMVEGMVAEKHAVAFASLTYKNFYEPVTVLQKGTAAESGEVLYHETAIQGTYGVPLNKFVSPHVVLNGVAYDTVIPSDRLPSALSSFWQVDNSTLAGIALDNIMYYNAPQTLTVKYNKIPSNWVTVDFYFTDESGGTIPVQGVTIPVTKTDWIPKGMSLSQAGVSYDVPSAVDTNLTPFMWVMYADDSFTTELAAHFEDDGQDSIGFDPTMPSNRDSVAIRIFYKSGQVFVTEKYINEQGAVLRTNPISIAAGGKYTRTNAPVVDSYIVAGYQIGTDDRVSLPLAADGKPVWSAVTLTNVNAAVNVTYFFAADANGDGVPDSSQVRVTTRWIGVSADSTPDTAIQPAVVRTVLRGTELTVYNDGASGNASHIIDGVSPLKWMFDNTRANTVGGKRTITPTADMTVTFYYDRDSGGVGVADKNQYVTEKFEIFNGASYTPIEAYPDMERTLVVGQVYSRNAPNIKGYVRYGYKLDDGAMAEFNGSVSVAFTATIANHTVTYIYKTVAEPITVEWKGLSLAGTTFSFGSVVYNGLTGDTLTLDTTLINSIGNTIDSNVWEFDSTSPPNAKYTFSDTAQTVTIWYKEKEQDVKFNILFVSYDGKLDSGYEVLTLNTSDPFTVEAWDIPGYAYDRYRIEEFGSLYAEGTESTVTLDPSKGEMTVTFFYRPATTSVTLRAVERSTGDLLFSRVYTGQTIGNTFTAVAPHIDGFMLAPGESILKTLELVAGPNIVEMLYDRSETVYINCIEVVDGREVILRSIPVTQTGTVTPPDLSGDYFVFDASNADNDNIPATVTNNDFAVGRTIRYYYQSRTMDVTVRLTDRNNVTIGTPIVLEGAARVGEMYTAAAPAAPAGYVLDSAATQTVYAHPDMETTGIVVSFRYHQRASNEVTVRHYYMDGEVKTILNEYTVSAIVGLNFTAHVSGFNGFIATGTAAKTITVSSTSKNVIEFEYTDVRLLLTIKTAVDGVVDDALTQTVKLPTGTLYDFQPPHISGYSLANYRIGNGAAVTTGLSSIDVTVNTDTTVTLGYVSYVTLTVKGVADNSPSQVLYSYDRRVLKGVPITLAMGKDVYILPDWNIKPSQIFTVTPTAASNEAMFLYTSKHVTVTISAKLEGTGAAVPGFTPIVVQTSAGQPFSYNAPYISGYVLIDNESSTMSSPAVTGDTEFAFTYTPAVGNVVVLLKEDGPAGRVIRTEVLDFAHNESRTLSVTGFELPLDAYTAFPGQAHTVTYKGVPLTVEFYYTKDTVQVYKRAYVDGTDTLISQLDMGRYRVGEVARFNAPSAVNHELLGDASRLELVEVPVLLRAEPNFEVRFNYLPITSGRLVVEAIDENGDIMQSYSLTGVNGTNITVGSPTIEGYYLVTGEPHLKNGVIPGKVTFSYEPLTRTAALDVSVTIAKDGTPCSGAAVKLTHGGSVMSYTTGAAGIVHIDSLNYGTYTVTVSLAGYPDATATFELTGDRSLQFALGKNNTTIIGGENNGGGTIDEGETDENENNEDITMPQEILSHRPYIHGYSDGTVRPDGFITRAEAAVIIYRLLSDEQREVAHTVTFSDVNGDWYENEVNTLATLGIMRGYEDGRFLGGRNMTRAEFAAVVIRFAGIDPADGDAFDDVNGHWAHRYVASAYYLGWVRGYPDGTFRPGVSITRAEAVKIVNQMLGRNPGRDTIPQEYNTLYSDLSSGHWAFEQIVEASVEHDFTWNDNGVEQWIDSGFKFEPSNWNPKSAIIQKALRCKAF